MYPQKYFTLNLIINKIFSVAKLQYNAEAIYSTLCIHCDSAYWSLLYYVLLVKVKDWWHSSVRSSKYCLNKLCKFSVSFMIQYLSFILLNRSNVVHYEHLAKKTAVVGSIYISGKIEHFSCDGVLSISRWLGSSFTLNKILC